jgi:hypothetical protein
LKTLVLEQDRSLRSLAADENERLVREAQQDGEHKHAPGKPIAGRTTRQEMKHRRNPERETRAGEVQNESGRERENEISGHEMSGETKASRWI